MTPQDKQKAQEKARKYEQWLVTDGIRANNENWTKVRDTYLQLVKQAEPGLLKQKMNMIKGLEDFRFSPDAMGNPSVMARMGRGMMDVWQGGRDLLGMANLPGGYSPEEREQVRGEVDMYESDVGDSFDGMRTVGQAVMTAPVAAIPGGASASWLPRLAAGATAGLTAGGVLYEQDPTDRIMNAALGTGVGGAVGVVAPPLVKLGGKLWGVGKEALKRVGQWIDDAGLDEQVEHVLRSTLRESGLGDVAEATFQQLKQEAKDSIRATGAFDADALARKARIEAAGFVDDAAPTTGQVTRDPRVMGKEYNIARMDDEIGEPLATRFGQQRSRALEIIDGFKRNIFGEGADQVTPYTAVKRISAMAQRKAGEWQGRVTAAYNKVDDGVTLSKESLRNRTWQLLEDLEDDIPSGVKTRVASILGDDSKAFTFAEWERLDKLITRTTGSHSKTEVRRAGGELKEAILGVLDDSEQAVSSGAREAYRAAKKAAQERFEAIGDPRKLLGQLAAGGADEKMYERLVKNATVDEMQAVMDFLDEPTRKWLRGSVLNDILEKAVRGGDYSQAGWNRELTKIGREKLRAIFGDQADQLKLFGDATEYLFHLPAGHSANVSGSGIANINFIQRLYKGLIEEIPGGRTYTSLTGGPKGIDPKDVVRKEISDLAMTGGHVKPLPLLNTPNALAGDSLEVLRMLRPMAPVWAAGLNDLPRKN